MKKIGSAIKWAVLSAVIFSVFIIILLYYLTSHLPQIEQLEYYEPVLGTKIFDTTGKLIQEYSIEKRKVVPLSKVPPELIDAILSIEDKDFYHHFGISIKRIIMAAFIDIKAGRKVEGASTLTQQLARVLFLTPKKTFSRKIKEALLALEIEKHYSKDEILQMYLNQVYFGAGNYGIAAAAKYYFKKNVSDLSLPECAMIAALPKAPNYYNPVHAPVHALERRDLVLYRMRQLKYISELEYIEALNTPLLLAKQDTTLPVGAYFLEHIRQFLEKNYGYNALYKNGLNVYTTINIDLQKKAEQLYNKHLDHLDKLIAPFHKNDTIPYRLYVSDTEYIDTFVLDTEPKKLQSALISLNVKNGNIIALIGGRNFNESQFNRAIQAQRQPGSAIKPLIYTAAIEKGYTVLNKIFDAPVAFPVGDTFWIPHNYEQRCFGWTTIKDALIHSRNIVSIKLLERVGVPRMENILQRFNVKYTPPINLSFALGSTTFSLLEIAEIYNTFPNYGIIKEPRFIKTITDRYGTIIYENTYNETVVLTPEVSYIMTYLLENVVTRGTGRRIGWMGFKKPSAGKTGTTDNYRDAWFIGFTPHITTAVWVGFDDMRSIGPNMTGSRAAIPLWTRFMEAANKNYPATPFKVPGNIVWRRYNTSTLKENDTGALYPFIKGTRPKYFGINER